MRGVLIAIRNCKGLAYTHFRGRGAFSMSIHIFGHFRGRVRMLMRFFGSVRILPKKYSWLC